MHTMTLGILSRTSNLNEPAGIITEHIMIGCFTQTVPCVFLGMDLI
jgi:hypothetical protein